MARRSETNEKLVNSFWRRPKPKPISIAELESTYKAHPMYVLHQDGSVEKFVMPENIHIVVTRPNRAIILINDKIYVRDFADAKALAEIATLSGDPPIVIDVASAGGFALMEEMIHLGYPHIARTTD